MRKVRGSRCRVIVDLIVPHDVGVDASVPDDDIDGPGRAVAVIATAAAPYAAAPHHPPSFTARPWSDDGVPRCAGGHRRSTLFRSVFTQSHRPEIAIDDACVAGDPERSFCTRAIPGNDVIVRPVRLHMRGPVQRVPSSTSPTSPTAPVQTSCGRVHGIAVLLSRIARRCGLPRRSRVWLTISPSAHYRRTVGPVAWAYRRRRWMSQAAHRRSTAVAVAVGSASSSSPCSSTLRSVNGGDSWMY